MIRPNTSRVFLKKLLVPTVPNWPDYIAPKHKSPSLWAALNKPQMLNSEQSFPLRAIITLSDAGIKEAGGQVLR
jgi:hypothetical protein